MRDAGIGASTPPASRRTIAPAAEEAAAAARLTRSGISRWSITISSAAHRAHHQVDEGVGVRRPGGVGAADDDRRGRTVRREHDDALSGWEVRGAPGVGDVHGVGAELILERDGVRVVPEDADELHRARARGETRGGDRLVRAFASHGGRHGGVRRQDRLVEMGR